MFRLPVIALLFFKSSTMPLPEPPSWDGAIWPDGAIHMGCEIPQITDFSGKHWFVYVYVDFPAPNAHRWTPTSPHTDGSETRIAYAIRDGTIGGNLDAMKDCHYWLKTTEKRQRERIQGKGKK